ncbi:putative cyclin [Helianthus annuus]|nr:putative cyclin [Helianthus annuus]
MLLACNMKKSRADCQISDKAYMRSEVLDMEKEMMNTLEFNILVPTPFLL